MRLFASVFTVLFCLGASSFAVDDKEPVTLLGTIVKWKYPGSKIHGAAMTDAATMDASKKRTVPSTMLKTTMTTADSVEDVLKFYKTLLKRDASIVDKLGDKAATGRSAIFSDESEGRPFVFHTISVNTSNASTILIVTRGAEETETRITWKRYLRHKPADKK